jgi:formiminoglutamate deiminase
VTDAQIPDSVSTVVWCESALLADGWARSVKFTITDGRIARIDTDAPAGDAQRLGPALPGLGNVHSHAFQRAMAGLAETRGETGDNFWTWREVMYRFLARLDPDMAQAIAAMGQVEMLEGGFTRVGEFHYLHHAPDGGFYDNPAEMAARMAAAAEETGIGLTLLPVFYAHSNFGGLPPTDGQKRSTMSTALPGWSRPAGGSSRACPRRWSASRRTACAR